MIRTLVVDDDFRVAEINAAYVLKVQGFSVCARVHNAADADAAIQSLHPDLVLLDLYLPDEHGLDLLRRVRAEPAPPDVIVITAARDADSIRAAMQLGAVHYLVKPFSFDRLAEQLSAYRALHTSVSRLHDASQEDVDKLYALMRPLNRSPKGTSQPTIAAVLETLQERAPVPDRRRARPTRRSQPPHGPAISHTSPGRRAGTPRAPLREHRAPISPLPREIGLLSETRR